MDSLHSAEPGARRFLSSLRTTLEMIQVEHSVFALPFALIGALLAARGWPTAHQFFWIVVAMVGARSAAMSFNRLIDRRLDALNPRTAARALPTGLLSARFVLVFALLSAAVLVFAAYRLNPLALRLSPVALAILFVYSYTKRFTMFSHLVLGFCLGIAPAAAWIAVRGTLEPAILLLTAAVTLWTAGFDILYACQDVDFDRRFGLHSVPQRWGIRRALQVSSALHVLMVILLFWLAWLERLGWLSLGGVAAAGLLLIYEHRLVKPHDLSRLNAAFFNTNGWIGILLLVFWAADILLLSV
ncbi:MAG: UbiA family prenyltransferase [Acidobacteria bacterium]|nr:UbiA family prenyltransferase [Acidobacteriota bacterium]